MNNEQIGDHVLASTWLHRCLDCVTSADQDLRAALEGLNSVSEDDLQDRLDLLTRRQVAHERAALTARVAAGKAKATARKARMEMGRGGR